MLGNKFEMEGVTGTKIFIMNTYTVMTLGDAYF